MRKKHAMSRPATPDRVGGFVVRQLRPHHPSSPLLPSANYGKGWLGGWILDLADSPFPNLTDAAATHLAEIFLFLFIGLTAMHPGFYALLAAFPAFASTAWGNHGFQTWRILRKLSTGLSTEHPGEADLTDKKADLTDAKSGLDGRQKRTWRTVRSGLGGRFLPRSPEPARPPEPFTRARLLTSFNFSLTSFTPPGRAPPPALAGPAGRTSLRSVRNLPEKEFASLTAILGRGAPPPAPPERNACGAAQKLWIGGSAPTPRQGACAPLTPPGPKGKSPFQERNVPARGKGQWASSQARPGAKSKSGFQRGALA